eukprot:m.331814 g.331814  ORF g.331814 m.331814 type:complete len:655 (-) comp16798_c0_seq1:190-2154(-)
MEATIDTPLLEQPRGKQQFRPVIDMDILDDLEELDETSNYKTIKDRLYIMRRTRPLLFWVMMAGAIMFSVVLPFTTVEESSPDRGSHGGGGNSGGGNDGSNGGGGNNGGGNNGGGGGGYVGDSSGKPNLVLMVVDDLGYSDMEFTTVGDVTGTTPTLGAMAANGTIMWNVYAQYQCTPTRSAVLTGRYPARFGMQENVLGEDSTLALPLEESTIAEHMRSEGYYPIHVGKWHVGAHRWKYTPTGRGFYKTYGYMFGGPDQDTKKADDYYDLWANREPDTENVGEGSLRTNYLFGNALYNYVVSAPSNKPVFLYFASQDPHNPMICDDDLQEMGRCAYMEESNRKIYCGMLNALDLTVQDLVAGLKETNRYDNTIFFLTSDNGGSTDHGGYNWPLRGKKGDMFDGGAKQVSFIWAGDNVNYRPARGTWWTGPVHVTDFTMTLIRLASRGPDGTGEYPQTLNNAYYPKDGIDFWDELVTNSSTPRTLVPIWIGYDKYTARMQTSYGDFKLIVNGKSSGWFKVPDTNGDSEEVEPNDCFADDNGNDGGRKRRGSHSGSKNEGGCNYLFDMKNDPYEQYNCFIYDCGVDADTVAYTISSSMTSLYNSIQGSSYTNEEEMYEEDLHETCAAKFGYWTPFMDWYDQIASTTTTTTQEPDN